MDVEPEPPYVDTRRRSLIIGLVLVAVLGGGLVFAGLYVLNSIGSFFRADLVKCKTFRGELAKVDAQFMPAYRPIERKIRCISGLDAPDEGKVTFVSDAEIFRDEVTLRQEVASRLKAAGWTQDSEADTFSIKAKVENNEVTYTAASVFVSANPAVIQLVFTPSATTFADFGSKQDYPPDIPLSKEDRRHYNAMQYALEQVPARYQIKETKIVSLTEVQIPLEHAASQPSSAESGNMTLVLKLATPETSASRCGGHVEQGSVSLVCEALGSTFSGREVFIANSTGNLPQRTLHNAYASFGNVDAVLVGGHPADGLLPEEILQIFEAITPKRL